MRVRDAGVMVAAVLALGACGGGGDAGSAADDGPGPLAELMGWQPVEPAEQRRKELEKEQAVAECMRAEGWEYEPVDWSAQMPNMGGDEELMSDPKAYAEKYGYGIMRNYELYDVPNIESGGQGNGVEFEDPNGDYVMSLSESEMEDYYATLYGEPQEVTDESGTMMMMQSLGDQGCSGQAQLEVYGRNPGDDPEIQERLTEFFQDQADDPRLRAAWDDWVECMGDTVAGMTVLDQPVDGPNQMFQVIDERKLEAMGLEQREIDTDDPSAYDGLYSSYQEDGGPEIGWYGTPELIPDDALERLRRAELALFREDQDCQDEVGLADLNARVERELVDDLRAEFPELADGSTPGG